MADASDTRHPADIARENELVKRKGEEAARQGVKPERYLGDTAGAPTAFPE